MCCTATKDDGTVCKLDFTNPGFAITHNAPVHACKEAMKYDTECVHAICHPCYKLLMSNSLKSADSGGRPRRTRRIAGPDERVARMAEV